MESNKILTADVLDIIFEGRNKEYGAYDLRKTYRQRITYAIIGTLVLCLLLFGLSLWASKTKKSAATIVVADVSLENMKDEKKPEPPPPPPPPKREPPKIEIKQFTPPKIVKDEQVKEPPPKQEEMVDTKIGLKNQEGIKEDVVAAPVETGTGKVEAPKDDEDYNKIFTSVQIEASYPGGMAAWGNYLRRNLDATKISDNGAPPGKYTVVLSFIVDKEGNISDVAAENDPGYGTKEEALRVLKKSGGWTSAIQNGRKVISRHKQQITFQIAEE
jgi:protein TonB